MIIFGVGGVVVLLALILIIRLIIGTKLNYAKIEDKMVSATREYFNEEGNELPLDGGIATVSYEDLVEAEKIKEITKYLGKNAKCSGEVSVRAKNDSYLYIPYLDCGDSYKTTSLTNYILSNEMIVTEKDGLYNLYNEYVYRGEYVNNYVSFAGELWRILKIDKDSNVKLIEVETNKRRSTWDDRYNDDVLSTVGINDYTISRIYKKIQDIEKEYSANDLMLITPKNICIGKRFLSSSINDGSVECARVLENQVFGLLPINEWLNASVAPNCSSLQTHSCQNYNYLTEFKKDWWSLTATGEKTTQAYLIRGKNISAKIASLESNVRLTTYLNSDVIYVKGNGTKDNPYVIK
jgi:hypothetical protein